jgi:hypothetical protein
MLNQNGGPLALFLLHEIAKKCKLWLTKIGSTLCWQDWLNENCWIHF